MTDSEYVAALERELQEQSVPDGDLAAELEALEASLADDTTDVDEELAAYMKDANLQPTSYRNEEKDQVGNLDDESDELAALMRSVEGRIDRAEPVEKDAEKKPVVEVESKNKQVKVQQLPTVPPSTRTTEIPHNAEPCGDSSYAHQVGYRLYKAGRLEEAKRWSRYAKTNSASSSSSVIRGSASVVQKPVKARDQYTPLEDALMKVIRAIRGPRNKSSDVTEEEKRYLKHLKIIHEQRKISNPQERADVPKFEWQVEKVLSINELVEIPEDHVHVMIHSAESLQAVLGMNSSKSVSIHYNLGFPRDDPLTGKTEAVNHDPETGKANFNFQTFLPAKVNHKILKKRAEFTLVKHKGFWPFASEEVLGMVFVPMEPLSTRCECTGAYELVDRGGTRSKAVGGTLNLSIRIRKPISNDGSAVADKQVLVIQEWDLKQSTDATATPTTTPTVSSNTIAEKIHADTDNNESRQQLVQPPTTGNPSDATALNLGKNLSDDEKKDPLHFKFYIQSFDLMNHEIEELEKSLQSPTGQTQEKKRNIQRRLLIMQTNRDGLQQRVQSGEIDLESYLQILRNRVVQDKALIKYLSYCGMQVNALKVMRRMNIINQEIKSSEGLPASK